MKRTCGRLNLAEWKTLDCLLAPAGRALIPYGEVSDRAISPVCRSEIVRREFSLFKGRVRKAELLVKLRVPDCQPENSDLRGEKRVRIDCKEANR